MARVASRRPEVVIIRRCSISRMLIMPVWVLSPQCCRSQIRGRGRGGLLADPQPKNCQLLGRYVGASTQPRTVEFEAGFALMNTATLLHEMVGITPPTT